MAKTTELVKPDTSRTAIALRDQIDAIEAIAREHSLVSPGVVDSGQLRRAFTVASGINQLRQALTGEIMIPIMSIQNSPLGFLTDNKAGYSQEIVSDCVIQALMWGANIAGNEFNIIASRTYFTVAYFTRMCRDFPGLSDVCVSTGLPEIDGATAMVKCRARWKFNGKNESEDWTFPVRNNQGMMQSALISKAKRAAMRAVIERVAGYALEGDANEDRSPLEVDVTDKSAPTLTQIHAEYARRYGTPPDETSSIVMGMCEDLFSGPPESPEDFRRLMRATKGRV